MIDFHSHVLPGIDDGSDSVETSLAMLNCMKSQGIEAVFATPHFYADRRDPASFLARRNAAYESLCACGSLPLPVTLGAEVHFFTGIGKSSDIESLCLTGTRLLLLEMPFREWSGRMIDEVEELMSRGIVPVAAHLERYKGFVSNGMISALCDSGVYVQANAEWFLGFWSKRKALAALKDESVLFLGSDAHNMSSRAPNLGPALAVIEKNLGAEFVESLSSRQKSVIYG